MIAPPWGYKATQGAGVWRCAYCLSAGDGVVDHKPDCRTAALESTAEAMAKALERLDKMIWTGPDGHTDCDCGACEGRAALASWRGLTGGKNG